MAAQKPPTISDDARAIDIYRQAAKVIHAKGFDATSMGDIAETVDLTKGGLYYYIKGKKALLFAIMDFAMSLIEKRVLPAARAEVDPDRRLSALIRGHVELVVQDASAMSILVYESEGLIDEYREKIQARKEAYSVFLRDTVRQVLEHHGRTGEIDPTVASFSLLGMIHWVPRWYDADGGLSFDQVAEQLTRFSLGGLAAGGTGTE